MIIPAYKPDEKLLHTLSGSKDAGFTDILVVDDGSGPEFEAVFAQVVKIPGCTLLRHPVNRGKGAALKTAFAYFLDNRPDGAGVVTADADGQHLPRDIVSVCEAMLDSGEIVLGARDFSDPKVPPRSRSGNKITRTVFRLFFGLKLQDTQTGLRAFPRRYLPELAAGKGERYEYETQMLFQMSRSRLPYREVKIETVYLEDNRSSHFRVVRDSLRIYSLILKYFLSSIAAAAIDEGAFYLFKRFAFLAVLPIPLTWSAAVLARAISSLVNFLLNASLVFGGKPDRQSLIRYYILAVGQIALSTLLVYLAERAFSITAPILSTLVKTAIDTILFFFSFRIQHKWVFNSRGKEQRA